MKRKTTRFKSLNDLRCRLDKLLAKQRTFKIIFKLLKRLDSFVGLLKEGYDKNDIAFALKRRIKLEHHLCPVCKSEIHVYKLQRYPKTCSVSCGNKNSQELRKKLSQKRHGVDNPHQLKSVKNKYEKTMLKKHGGYTFQSKSLMKKVSATNKKRYGVEVAGSSKELHKKGRQTCMKKYGVDHPWKSGEIREKCKETNMRLHGSRTFNNRKKNAQTCLKRYGVENPSQNSQIRSRAQTRYKYKNINFDSSWEIALYVWLTDNRVKFEYHPDCKLAYEFKRRTFYYQPDFRVDGKFVELKGDQYFNKSGSKMICPYDKKLNGKYNAKFHCMLENEVQILRNKDMKKYLDYVDEKHGKGWMKQFKRKPKDGTI